MTRLAVFCAVFLGVIAGASARGAARAADGDGAEPEAAHVLKEVSLDLDSEFKNQFADLRAQIWHRSWFERIASQAYRREALVLATDRDPVDVVLRRTEALLAHLAPAIGPSEHEKFAAELRKLREASVAAGPGDDCKEPYEILIMDGWQVVTAADKGALAERFYLPDYDPDLDSQDVTWQKVNVREGAPPYPEKYIFYRNSVEVPADWKGKISITFRGVDDNAVVYLNGLKVGEHRGRKSEFIFDVTEAIRPGEKNLVAVLCENTRGRGGINREVTLRQASVGGGRYDLFARICRLRRRIAFTNPLLDFDKLAFMKCHFTGYHSCDQYFGFKARPGGGVFVLSKPFGERPGRAASVRLRRGPTEGRAASDGGSKGAKPTLLDIMGESTVERGRLEGRKLDTGSFLSLSLSFDAATFYFAYTQCGKGEKWSPERCWHVFKARVDGTGLEQLTDGAWNEFAPCELPSGRIAFISERRGGYGRCHPRPVPTYTLHSMMPDGSDIVRLSYHETNEWHPSVNHDGMIVYTRWDYVDRGDCIAHHPWITFPDGRDPRAIQGNYPVQRNARPDMEVHVRAIPGSHKYVATAAGHHQQAYGSLVVIDPRVQDDGAMAPVRRLTPEIPFPEVEGGWPVYATAWPLSEHYYLSAYRPGGRGRLGIYVVDAFGNKELVFRDEGINSIHPIPFRAQKRPPLIPHATAVGRPEGGPAPGDEGVPTTGTISCVNVYEGLMPWPKGTTIKALRVVQLFPKSTILANEPRISLFQESLARGVLGTVPVEEDGSARFTAPAGKLFYFQALDENGCAVQSMMSDTYVHPGERLTCQGCHEPRLGAPPAPTRMPLAFRRGPSVLKPDVDGTLPVSFPRLVQPVLDARCVGCHEKEKKAPDLSGEGSGYWGWSKSYGTLARHARGESGKPAGRIPTRTTPGEFGARASKLYRMLTRGEKGHDKVKLSPEEMHRIVVWLDLNSNFFGAYHDLDRQLKGEFVKPDLE